MSSKYVLVVVFCIMTLRTIPAHGEAVTTVQSTRRVFTSSELPAPGSNGLTEVGFWVEQYRINWKFGAPIHEQGFGTKLYAWYRTQKPEKLRDFVFVQFIRGCTFETKEVNGTVKVSHTKARTFFGSQGVPFSHPDWVIDSVDTDPAYWTDPEYPDRHALLRWGIDGVTFPNRPLDYPTLNEQQPVEPRVFIADYPQGGDIRWNKWANAVVATNSTFRFKTCLFRSQDVPTRANPDTKLPQPIICMWWDSLYVYDHTSKKMTTPAEIAPACTASHRTSGKGTKLS
jgi:hypothetical protein